MKFSFFMLNVTNANLRNYVKEKEADWDKVLISQYPRGKNSQKNSRTLHHDCLLPPVFASLTEKLLEI